MRAVNQVSRSPSVSVSSEVQSKSLPTVTVVTACFNSAGTVRDTLASMKSQEGVIPQWIVLDGGSTDGTREILREALPATATLIEEPDAGIYDALNKGFGLATGEVIGLLHADDVFEHRHVVAHIAACFLDPAVDAVYGDLVYVARDDLSRVIRNWRSGELRQNALSRGWMPPHTTLFMRRRVWERVGPFDMSYRISADYEFMLRLLRDEGLTIRYLPERLVRMRVGGLSNRSLANRLKKSQEDLRAVRAHGVGGVLTVVAKVLRKLPQYLPRRG